MKKYIEDIGYIEVVELSSFTKLPPEAIYYYSDTSYHYYITAVDDAVYAIKL